MNSFDDLQYEQDRAIVITAFAILFGLTILTGAAVWWLVL